MCIIIFFKCQQCKHEGLAERKRKLLFTSRAPLCPFIPSASFALFFLSLLLQRPAAADRDILLLRLWLILVETDSSLVSPSLPITRRLVLPESRRVCLMPFSFFSFFLMRACVFVCVSLCFWEALCCRRGDSSLLRSSLSSRGINCPRRSTRRSVFLVESLAEKIVSRSCVAVVGSLKRPLALTLSHTLSLSPLGCC